MTLTRQGLHLENKEGNEESEGKGASSSAPWAPLLPLCPLYHQGALPQPPGVHKATGTARLTCAPASGCAATSPDTLRHLGRGWGSTHCPPPTSTSLPWPASLLCLHFLHFLFLLLFFHFLLFLLFLHFLLLQPRGFCCSPAALLRGTGGDLGGCQSWRLPKWGTPCGIITMNRAGAAGQTDTATKLLTLGLGASGSAFSSGLFLRGALRGLCPAPEDVG